MCNQKKSVKFKPGDIFREKKRFYLKLDEIQIYLENTE